MSGPDEGKDPMERMASVVGHEVRNPLATMGNSVYFLQAKLKQLGVSDEKVFKHLGILDAELKRANGILEEILSFSREPRLRKESGAVDALVEEALGAMVLPDAIELQTSMGAAEVVLSLDVPKISKVVQALVKNAADALVKGGRIKVATMKTAGGVVLEVSDNGPGLAAGMIDKILQPFYTTKPKGVGLGLTLAKKIVESHGGSLDLKSTLGRGTTVTVRLPG